MNNKSRSTFVVLGTGGTISGRSARDSDNVAYAVGEVGVDALVRDLPGGSPDNGMVLLTEQIAQIDSKDMRAAVWRLLAERCLHYLALDHVGGIVVTHGTDTMEETAFFLHMVLSGAEAPAKPVVLTGAMRPASSLSPDGPQNLRDALVVAAHAGAVGVVVVMAGAVYAGSEVQKAHCYRLDAFDAGDAGALGYVEEGRLRMVRAWPSGNGAVPHPLRAYRQATRWPRVEIVMSYAGADGCVVDALLEHAHATGEALDGIVVAGTGNGTVHQDLEAALLRARARGVVVVRSTRCSKGRVLSTEKDTLPDAEGLSPVKARIAMMLRMMEQGGADQPHRG